MKLGYLDTYCVDNAHLFEAKLHLARLFSNLFWLL